MGSSLRRSKLCTPLRGERQATILRSAEMHGTLYIGLASNLMPLSVLKDKNWDLGVSYVQKYVSRVK